MRVEHLKVFSDLAETGQFTRAAQRNGMTQSAVSQMVWRLEKEMNALLVDRFSKRFQLTKEGTALVSFAREVLDAQSKLFVTLRGF